VIRTLDGSEDSEINALAVSKEGEVFVSAGNDRQVKLWGYDDGQCYRVGLGHAAPINKVLSAHPGRHLSEPKEHHLGRL